MDFNSNTKITKYIWLSLGKSVLLFILITSLFLTPAVTQASFLSSAIDSVASIFSSKEASAQTETIIENNSQNMELLESPTSIDPLSDSCLDLLTMDGEGALLPPSGPSTSAPCEVDSSGGSIITYIVRENDTPSKIAEMFDVSVNTILWYNNLSKNSVLKVGQTLYILPISGVMHTVVSGDTLNTIAKNTNGDVDEIASFNNMKVTDKLTVGDEIMIPNGQINSSSRPATISSALSYSGYYIKPFAGGHKTQGLHGYKYSAVDYGMPVGTPLYASAAGTVIISKNSGWNDGYGDYVKIQHPNGTVTIYGHMSGTIVSVGQAVAQGQTIGYSGNTGNSTGPHLHFEIRGAKNPF